MTLPTIGDGLQYYRLRHDGNHLKTDLQRLTSELSTGRQADLGRALDGNFTVFAELSRSLKLTDVFAETIAQATVDANLRQTALGKVEAEVSGFGARILSFATSGSMNDMLMTVGNAPERFSEAVNAINMRVAGRSLFAGDAPDQAALLSGPDILTELRSLVAGATTAADMMAQIDRWFMDPGGGYETLAWQGGSGEAAPVVLGEGQVEEAAVSALDPALRETLSGLALAALVSEGDGATSDDERRLAASGAASRMMSGEANLIVLRSDLGASQARIEAASVEVAASRQSLEIERNRLMEADPYRTATDLETVQARLESLYVVTARLARLTIAEYLR